MRVAPILKFLMVTGLTVTGLTVTGLTVTGLRVIGLTVIGLGGGLPWAATASELRYEAAKSVIQIRCVHSGGEMKATGFIWPKAGQLVTALHAVVGCDELKLYSEATGTRTEGRVVKALLEADLALVEMRDGLGLAPVDHSVQLPELSGSFEIWGYPHAAEEMLDLDVEFSGGLKRGVTTLELAYTSEKLNQLFSTQTYPQRSTEILRVGSTLVKGHSGAPIFDPEGRVVAIADGGLGGGTKTVNWSIPAHIYLDKLQNSRDAIPQKTSSWAVLYSATVPQKTATLALRPEEGTEGGFEEFEEGEEFEEDVYAQAGYLTLVQQITLSDVVAAMSDDPWVAEQEDLVNILEAVQSFGIPEEAWEQITFDIYEDYATGATVAVPSWLELSWNDDYQAAQAVNFDGSLAMYVGLTQGETFDEALDFGAEQFIRSMHDTAEWDGVGPFEELEYDEFDEEYQFAQGWGTYEGYDWDTGQLSGLYLKVAASQNVFLGSALYVHDFEREHVEDSEFEAMMMVIAAAYLSDFAIY